MHIKRKKKKIIANNAILLTYPISLPILNFIYIYIFFLTLFIWLHRVLAVACGIPNPGIKPRPQHWEMRVLATGPPGESLSFIFLFTLFLKNLTIRTSLVAQWLTIRLPFQKTQVRPLVWEDSTWHGATKPVRHNFWAPTVEPVSHSYRSRWAWSRALQQEEPLQWEGSSHNTE